MNAVTLDAATLHLAINEAFGQTPYPGARNIVIDNRDVQRQCDEIRAALQGLPWRDLSFETLERVKTALPFLSPPGYRYYLPAFMAFSVINFPRAGIIPDEVVRSLMLPHVSDVARTRELAKAHPQVQPLASAEWEQLLRTIEESYRSGVPEKTFLDRVTGFDDTQRRVIRQFLEHMKYAHNAAFPNNEPQIAIERYWQQF